MTSSYAGRLLTSPTVRLLRIIGSPFIPEGEAVSDGESLELYHHAIKNKIPLLYLESLRQKGELNQLKAEYGEEYAKYLRFLNAVARVAKVLKAANTEYAIFKTIKPYPAVPSDVDIIILGNDDIYQQAAEVLLRARYTPYLPHLVDITALSSDDSYRKAAEVSIKPTYGKDHVSPTGAGFIDPEFNIEIDLRKEIAVSYIVYLDKNNFRGHITKTQLPNGDEINTPTPELDLATVIAHSLMDRAFRLGEYYTLLYQLSKMDEEAIHSFLDTVRENNITIAARAYAGVTAALHKAAHGGIPEKLGLILSKLGYKTPKAGHLVTNNFDIPNSYTVSTLTRVMLEKLKEKRFSQSLSQQMVKMLNPALTKLVINDLIQRRKG